MFEIDYSSNVDDALPSAKVGSICSFVLAKSGIDSGHLSVSFVEEPEIQLLNAEHRKLDKPTDVLSFPVDQSDEVAGPRELGDIYICPPQCHDLQEALVHGLLHLAGMDHETDTGEMLALQDRIMEELTSAN